MLAVMPCDRRRAIGARLGARAALAGLVLVSLSGGLAAQSQPPSPYLDLVARYAAGDRAEAIAALGAWTESDLNAEMKVLRALAAEAESCKECSAKDAFAELPLRHAVMLHVDRAQLEWDTLHPGDDASPECGGGPHKAMAERLAQLAFGQPEGRDFARRWYLAMTVRSQERTCFEDALGWAHRGLKWFPKDPDLLLALGTVEEVVGTLTPRHRVNPGLSGTRLQEAVALAAERPSRLKRARQALEEALAVEAGLDEARLRLGRVQWRLTQYDAAEGSLRAVLARSQDGALLYLAHLFLGQIHEDAGRLDETEREYRAALALDPAAQAAAVALAHALELAGERAASREVLAGAVGQARRKGRDAYWWYLEGSLDRSEALFDQLRQGSRP